MQLQTAHGSHPMRCSIFPSVFDAYTTPATDIETDWHDLATLLLDLHVCPSKADAQLFNLWHFEGAVLGLINKVRVPGTTSRCAENAKLCYGIVLDYDNNLHLEQAIDLFAGVECVIYTTHSHRQNKHKFRVVLPLKHPVSQAELKPRITAIIDTFGAAMDRASFSISQSFYIHSCPAHQVEHAVSLHLAGELFNLLDLEAEAPPPPPAARPASTKAFSDDQASKYLSTLLDCLAPVTTLRRADAARLIPLIRSAGGDLHLFIDLCRSCCDASSSLNKMSDREYAHLWQLPGDRMTAHTRDKLLVELGGKPYPKPADKTLLMTPKLRAALAAIAK